MQKQELNVLFVSASARQTDSITRQFANEMLAELRRQYAVKLKHRDVAKGVAFIDEHWIEANFIPAEQRSPAQQDTLLASDGLVDELHQADVILIAAPIYNFSIPASLKAWIDQVARVGLTFNYTSTGPVGKLQGKKAYIVFASGGTEIGSEIDFASGYLRHILGFMGVKDVSFISAARYKQEDEQARQKIRAHISELARHAA